MVRITDWSIIAKKDSAMVEMFIADAKDSIHFEGHSKAKAAKEAILTYEEFIPRDISRLALRKLVISHLERPRPVEGSFWAKKEEKKEEKKDQIKEGTYEEWLEIMSKVD